jgi:hypothetical protein
MGTTEQPPQTDRSCEVVGPIRIREVGARLFRTFEQRGRDRKRGICVVRNDLCVVTILQFAQPIPGSIEKSSQLLTRRHR